MCGLSVICEMDSELILLYSFCIKKIACVVLLSFILMVLIVRS